LENKAGTCNLAGKFRTVAFLEKWRYKLGEASLRRQMKKTHRQVKAFNLRQAKEVGILFDATTLEKYEPVRSFIAFLQDQGIHTHVLGYINDKKIPDSYLLRRSFHFFSKNELSWTFRPVSQHAVNFCEKNFDILFSLDTADLFPLRYLASLSKAYFKVGRFFPYHQHLDFMINLKDDTSVGYLIEQIKTYLMDLRTGNETDINQHIPAEK